MSESHKKRCSPLICVHADHFDHRCANDSTEATIPDTILSDDSIRDSISTQKAQLKETLAKVDSVQSQKRTMYSDSNRNISTRVLENLGGRLKDRDQRMTELSARQIALDKLSAEEREQNTTARNLARRVESGQASLDRRREVLRQLETDHDDLRDELLTLPQVISDAETRLKATMADVTLALAKLDASDNARADDEEMLRQREAELSSAAANSEWMYPRHTQKAHLDIFERESSELKSLQSDVQSRLDEGSKLLNISSQLEQHRQSGLSAPSTRRRSA